MSRSAQDNPSPSAASPRGHASRSSSRVFTHRQMRAIRKEVLLTRAAVERMEMVEASLELRDSLARFSWLKLLLPISPRMGRMGKVLREHPLVGSVASVLLAAAPRIKLLRKLVKWGAIGFTAWETWQLWQQHKPGAAPASNAEHRK